MKNTVIIKGNRYGISIVFDKDIAFSQLLTDLEHRLEDAEEFFDSDKQLAVSFEGRELSNEELDQVLTVIKECSRLNIQYVMEENSDLETTFFDIIQTAQESESEEEKEPIEVSGIFETIHNNDIHAADAASKTGNNKNDSNGLFYKGTLRSGQDLDSKESVVIIGDVNPGAHVTSGGNIVVIGALKGTATAGCNNNPDAFVMALVMDPIQIQIADVIARCSDNKSHLKKKKEPMIATIRHHQICMEPVTKSAIYDIK